MSGKRIDDPNRPMCRECGVRVVQFINYSPVDGRPMYKTKCFRCQGYVNGQQTPYKAALKKKKETLTCEKCGFKAVDTCQLDVDHIDGDKSNNDPSNHQILCANCHRLKTKLNKDGSYGRTANNRWGDR